MHCRASKSGVNDFLEGHGLIDQVPSLSHSPED